MQDSDERMTLFNQVWAEPMTTVAKYYGISDNGLRKRCIGMGIPLPPVGYWAKLKAGLPVPLKPKLPTMQKTKSVIVLKNGKVESEMETIDLQGKSSELLATLQGEDTLTESASEAFEKWCSRIEVPKRIEFYHPLVIECQEEIAYRKVRDKEHQFHDVFKYRDVWINTSVKYRENQVVIPILVSEASDARACRITDTLFKTMEALGGKIKVKKASYERQQMADNAEITLFGERFTFEIKETMIKRRQMLGDIAKEVQKKEFKPVYEKLYSGQLDIKMVHVKIPKWGNADVLINQEVFSDAIDNLLEKQLGRIIKTLFKWAQEAKIARIIEERAAAEKAAEVARQRESEREKQERETQRILLEKRKKELVENVEEHMKRWDKSKKLQRYAEELEMYMAMLDKENQEKLGRYIELVKRKSEVCDPIEEILKEIKGLE